MITPIIVDEYLQYVKEFEPNLATRGESLGQRRPRRVKGRWGLRDQLWKLGSVILECYHITPLL